MEHTDAEERDHPVDTGDSAPAGGNNPTRPDSDRIVLVFDIWCHFAHKNAQTVLTDKRRTFIRKALAAYDLQFVLDAVIGWSYSDFHRGVNDRRKPYNDIELILRDAQHIEQFAGYTHSAGQSAPLEVPATRPEPVAGPSGAIGVFSDSGRW